MNRCRLFLTPEALETWLSHGRVEVTGDILRDTSTDVRFKVQEGVRFVCEVTGAGDVHDLVGRVKDLDQLRRLGAEHIADSVVLGDTAYTVVEGFVGTPMDTPDVRDLEADANPRQTLVALQTYFLRNVT